jgi:hypothetical protein
MLLGSILKGDAVHRQKGVHFSNTLSALSLQMSTA